jgi:phytoene dehydrogenase-like protein
MPQFDSIVIGTGHAGPALAVRLAEAGYRVAVIERHFFTAPASIQAAFPPRP